MKTHTAAVALFVVILATLTGCTTISPTPPQPPTTTSAARETGDRDEIPAPSVPAAEDGTAAEAAVAAMEVYARRDLSYSEWFARLKPLLDESAVEAYATVNPARIPVMTVEPGTTVAPTSQHVRRRLRPHDSGYLYRRATPDGRQQPMGRNPIPAIRGTVTRTERVIEDE